MNTIDLQKLAGGSNIDKKVLEVYATLKMYMDAPARHAWIKRYDLSWDTIENNMWTEEEKAELREHGQVDLVINKCVKGVQGSSAIVTAQKPELKFFPVGSGDLYVAELLKRGIDFVWARNEGTDATYAVVEETKVGATGFFDAKHDPHKGIFGRVVFEDSCPTDFYWDEDSRKKDFSDTHLIKAKLRTKNYIKDHYEDITDDDLIYLGEMKEDRTAKSSGVTGADSYTIESDKPDQSGDYSREPKNIWEIEAWMLKTVHEDWITIETPKGTDAKKMGLQKGQSPEDFLKALPEKENTIYGHWRRKLDKRVLRIIVGKKLISEEEDPYGADADGNPVMATVGLNAQKTRKAYYMSPTMYAKEINREKNKRRAQFIHAVSHNVNAPIVETEGKVAWTGNPGTPGSRAKVDPNTQFPGVMRLQSGSFDANKFLQLEQIADKDIDDQYDLHDVMRGKMPAGQSQIAGRTVLALQDMGGMMSKPFLRALESAMVRLAKVLVAIMLKHWPRKMWEDLVEPDEWRSWTPNPDEEETPDEEAIKEKWMNAIERIRPTDQTKPPGISLIDLDIRVTAGSSMPTNRIARSEVAIELKGAGIYDAEAALEYIDDPQKDKLIPRIKKQEQAAAQAAAMKGAK